MKPGIAIAPSALVTQLDHTGVGPDVGLDVGRGADEHDSTVFRSECLDLRLRCVHGHDLAAAHDQIGRTGAVRAGARQTKSEDDDADERASAGGH